MATLNTLKLGSATYGFDAEKFAGQTKAEWESKIKIRGQVKTDDPNAAHTQPATTASANTEGYIYLVKLGTEEETGAYTEFVTVVGGTTATPTYAWEKIGTTSTDLTEYAKKGTYTTGGPSSNSTGETDLGSATGTASVTYKKATGTANAGGHKHSVTATGSVSLAASSATTDFQVTGTISKVSKAAHNHSIGSSTGSAINTITWSAGGLPTYGTATVVTGVTGTVSVLKGVKASGTATVLTGVKANGTATVLTGVKGNGTATVVTGVTHTAASLGTQNKGTFVTGVSAVGLTGNINAMKATVNGTVLEFVAGDKGTLATNGGSASYGQALTSISNFSGGSASYTTTTVLTGVAADGTTTVLTGVAANGTTTAVTGVTSDGTASVILNDGLVTATKNFISGVGSLPSLTYTTATVVTGVNANTGDGGAIDITPTFTGGRVKASFSGTAVDTTNAGTHSHTITDENATASGTASVAIGKHTHTLSNHTHNVYVG